ncbi:hypothetical protein OSTOST_05792, partial [Ostertagia ostertagi]
GHSYPQKLAETYCSELRTEEEIYRKYEESKRLFSKIGMNLREYVSNSANVNSKIPEKDRAAPGEMKILGVIYDTTSDRFTVKAKFEMKPILTKREVGDFENDNVEIHFVHVPTLLNPADAGTRGLTSVQLYDHPWITGPSWIMGENMKALKPIEDIHIRENEPDFTEAPSIIVSEPKQTSSLIDLGNAPSHSGQGRKRSLKIKIKPIVLSKFDSAPHISADDMNLAEKLLIRNIHENVKLDELQKRFPRQKIIRDSD